LGLRESKEEDGGVGEGRQGDRHDEDDEEDGPAPEAELTLVVPDLNVTLPQVVLVLPREGEGLGGGELELLPRVSPSTPSWLPHTRSLKVRVPICSNSTESCTSPHNRWPPGEVYREE